MISTIVLMKRINLLVMIIWWLIVINQTTLRNVIIRCLVDTHKDWLTHKHQQNPSILLKSNANVICVLSLPSVYLHDKRRWFNHRCIPRAQSLSSVHLFHLDEYRSVQAMHSLSISLPTLQFHYASLNLLLFCEEVYISVYERFWV